MRITRALHSSSTARKVATTSLRLRLPRKRSRKLVMPRRSRSLIKSEMEELIRSLEERRSSENYERIKWVSAILGPMGEFGRDIPAPPERWPPPRCGCGCPERGAGSW